MGVEDGTNPLELCHIDNYVDIQIPSFDVITKVRDIEPTEMVFKNWISGLQAALDLISRQVE